MIEWKRNTFALSLQILTSLLGSIVFLCYLILLFLLYITCASTYVKCIFLHNVIIPTKFVFRSTLCSIIYNPTVNNVSTTTIIFCGYKYFQIIDLHSHKYSSHDFAVYVAKHNQAYWSLTTRVTHQLTTLSHLTTVAWFCQLITRHTLLFAWT